MDRWTDSEGNIWYKIHFTFYRFDGNTLAKIVNNGNVLERLDYMGYPPRFPTQIDPMILLGSTVSTTSRSELYWSADYEPRDRFAT